MTKQRKNHFGMARFSVFVMSKILEHIKRRIDLPGDYGMGRSKEEFSQATMVVSDITHEMNLECYPRVAGMSWDAIVLAVQAQRQHVELKELRERVYKEVRELKQTAAAVEAKINAVDVFINSVATLHGESSTAGRWLAYSRPHVVQVVCARRSALDMANHSMAKGEWEEAWKWILETKAAEQRADDLLNLIRTLVESRFYGRAKILKQTVLPAELRPS